MTQNTKIEWADHTFNPWWGCTKISPACDHCYAAALDKRTGGDHWGANQPRKRTSAKNWLEPVKWNKQADAFFAEHGRRQRVFCASMADVFDNEVDSQWRADLFALIATTPNLDWLLLTKRIGNVKSMVPAEFLAGSPSEGIPANVWLGATICNQEEADRDIPKLLAVPAAKRFLSIEPMLSAITLPRLCDAGSVPGPSGVGGVMCPRCYGLQLHGCLGVDWIICGGESGPGARPMHPNWARSLRDQCDAASVPFFFKQWGDWHPKIWQEGGDIVVGVDTRVMTEIEGREMVRIGKKAAGRLLDGMEHDGAPT